MLCFLWLNYWNGNEWKNSQHLFRYEESSFFDFYWPDGHLEVWNPLLQVNTDYVAKLLETYPIYIQVTHHLFPQVGPARTRKLHMPSSWVRENSLGHTLLGNNSPARVRLILWIRKGSTVYWWTHHLGISVHLDLRFQITLSLFAVYWFFQLITLISD